MRLLRIDMEDEIVWVFEDGKAIVRKKGKEHG